MPLLNYCKYSLNESLIFNYESTLIIENEIKFINSISKEDLQIDDKLLEYSPRHVNLFEANIHSFYLFLIKSKEPYSINFNEELINEILDDSYDVFYKLNYKFRKDLDKEFEKYFKTKHFEIENKGNYAAVSVGKEQSETKDIIAVAVANHKINQSDIELSIKNKGIISDDKKRNLFRILNQAQEEKSDILILPEITVPLKWLSRMADESRRKQRAFITGVEHFSVNKICYNFLLTILPIKIDGSVESIIIPRLKNHYSPDEELLIKGIRYKVPKSEKFYYHLFKWRGISFVAFNCFELADVEHRSLFKGKVDIIFASEFNRDWKYFSNIAESITRDVHCYYVQSNTSDIGDSRIIQPTESNRKDILRLKGGEKSSALVGKLDIKKLRAFQEKEFYLQKELKTFKPTPPSFDKDGVNER